MTLSGGRLERWLSRREDTVGATTGSKVTGGESEGGGGAGESVGIADGITEGSTNATDFLRRGKRHVPLPEQQAGREFVDAGTD